VPFPTPDGPQTTSGRGAPVVVDSTGIMASGAGLEVGFVLCSGWMAWWVEGEGEGVLFVTASSSMIAFETCEGGLCRSMVLLWSLLSSSSVVRVIDDCGSSSCIVAAGSVDVASGVGVGSIVSVIVCFKSAQEGR